jgi:(p)ppGpp synthase/HD superfamily hydrolase
MAAVVGYSDRVNHAFAFAAKHHDRQVRKGTALPYLTHPANVAVILTRYGCDEDTVLASILHDVVEDCVRDGFSRADLEERIGAKFGPGVLTTVLAVTERKIDDEGVDLSWDERKDDYLERLAAASESARWVCAADKLHNASTILADLKRTAFPETVWGRFTRGPEMTAGWYRRVYDRLAEVGFRGSIMGELLAVVEPLELAAAGAQVVAPR